MEQLYYCKDCQQHLPASAMIKDKHATGGYRRQCKQCRSNYVKDWREKDVNGFVDGVNRRMRKFRATTKGAILQRLVSAKTRATQSGLPFDIDVQYLRDLYEKQKGLCAYTGEVMQIQASKSESKWPVMSLDKIDPQKGYVKGNVQFVTMRVNTMKNDMNHEQFVQNMQHILTHIGVH